MLENNVRTIKHKVGLLNLAEELGNVSRACKTIGLSRAIRQRLSKAGLNPCSIKVEDSQT
jgi:hypothetical protein